MSKKKSRLPYSALDFQIQASYKAGYTSAVISGVL